MQGKTSVPCGNQFLYLNRSRRYENAFDISWGGSDCAAAYFCRREALFGLREAKNTALSNLAWRGRIPPIGPPNQMEKTETHQASESHPSRTKESALRGMEL